MKNHSHILLSVGGHDPSGCAGVMADQEIWQNYQISHRVVLTAVTAQSKNRFYAWEAVSLKLFYAELEAVKQNLWGVKIGMIASPRHAQVLADWLQKQTHLYVIWDPVWQASTGAILLRSQNFSSKLKYLLRQCQGFTPNLPEAAWIFKKNILSEEAQLKSALESIYQLGNQEKRWVLIKGGHTSQRNQVNDWFYDGSTYQKFTTKRLTGNPRGTGCRLAAAILAELYQGQRLDQAIANAKKHITALLF